MIRFITLNESYHLKIIVYALYNSLIPPKLHLVVGVSDVIYRKKIWSYIRIMKSPFEFGQLFIHGSHITSAT